MILLALLTSITLDAHRSTDLAEAMTWATNNNAPIIAFVHGSDWNRRGEKLYTSMWSTHETDRLFAHRNIVLLDIDVLQSPSEAEAEAQKGRHNAWKSKGLKTYPALIALLPNGSRLGSRQGEELPSLPELAQSQVLELGKASLRSVQLRAIAQAAADRQDSTAERDAIIQIIELPLDRPTTLLKRLVEIDPADETGIHRRLTMPPWNTFVSQATKDAKEGRSEEAIDRLQGMIDANIYTPEQQAWVYVALGSVHRNTSGHEGEAAMAFSLAHKKSPETLAGNAGRRLHLVLYADPSLELGWTARSCSTERTEWTLADPPPLLEPGSYKITFDFQRGRHNLHIDKVEFVDPETGEAVAIDSHLGIISKKPERNTFELNLDKTLANPIIRIHSATTGGTNSNGSITISGPGLDK